MMLLKLKQSSLISVLFVILLVSVISIAFFVHQQKKRVVLVLLCSGMCLVTGIWNRIPISAGNYLGDCKEMNISYNGKELVLNEEAQIEVTTALSVLKFKDSIAHDAFRFSASGEDACIIRYEQGPCIEYVYLDVQDAKNCFIKFYDSDTRYMITSDCREILKILE